jgi:hypothetical protein
MSQAVRTKETAALLQAIYKNVKMASDSILNLMPKVKDSKLKNDLTVQLSVYEAYASRAAKLLADEGVKPEDESTVTKLASKWGTMMNTMMDSTSTHIAEMMIEGATMGVNDLLEQMRGAKNGEVSDEAMRLLQDVHDYEERVIKEMKEYLLK